MSTSKDIMRRACEIEKTRSENYLKYLTQNMTPEQVQQAQVMYELKNKKP